MNPSLHSKIIGDGKPLLILHGFLGMSDNWKTLGSHYASAGYQVHLIDQRNHGKSFWSQDFNYDVLSDDLYRYITDQHLEKVCVIGHSMGGKTAMQFACDHPLATEKLIVADIAPKYYPPHHDQIIDGLKALDFATIASRGEADDALQKHIEDQGTRQFLLKNLYWIEKGKLGFRFNLKVLGEKMNEIGENIGTTAVYDGPTFFLRGDRSEYIIPSDMDDIKKHFPLARLESIDNAGHWLHAENPTQFFEKSIAFLNT